MNAHQRRKVIVVGLVLGMIYVSSYLVLSRRGFLQADQWNSKGFYFITPTSHAAWQVNWCLVIIYYPVIVIDNMLGTGRPVGSEPIYHLSLGGQEVRPGRDQRALFVRSNHRILGGDRLPPPRHPGVDVGRRDSSG